ncbi:hypothetical protein Tco_0715964 [Tanacetum coccineum]
MQPLHCCDPLALVDCFTLVEDNIGLLEARFEGSQLPNVLRIVDTRTGTDISEITRKPSKIGKHGHENQKSTKRSQRIKSEAR